MLRIKKISDAFYPRDFSSFLEDYKEAIEEKKEVRKHQIDNIKNQYQKQLHKLQKSTKQIKFSKKIEDLKSLYEEDPYSFAYEYNIDFQLSKSEIKNIKNQISTKIIKTHKEKEEISNKITEKELFIISEAYKKNYDDLIKKYPPKDETVYEDTKDSLEFKKKYEKNNELFAKDFNLDLLPKNKMPFSDYVFVYSINSRRKKTHVFITDDDKEQYEYYDLNYIMDIKSENSKDIEKKAIIYNPVLDNIAFFLYKNCLYQAEFNEAFSEDELLLLVKEKLYKDDKKFSQLKKQIELYENSEVANTSKRTREPIPEEVKFEVWRRDQGRCVKCGSQENLEFDHIIPFSKGGSSTARNIQLLCQNCNRHKSDKI